MGEIAMSKKNKILLIGYGYIGQYLYAELTKKGYEITVVSKNLNGSKSDFIEASYEELTQSFLKEFTHILWFAGHSSVAMSVEDPLGAINNNVISLFDLVGKIKKSKLIYASSASVYSGLSTSHLAGINDGIIKSMNVYDSTKKAFDILLEHMDFPAVGFRMGTVSGWSPALREELVFNQMNISAIKNGVVNVANQNNWRSILFLSDLCQAIEAQLDRIEVADKIINVASLNIKFGDLANSIARYHSVPVRDHGNTGSYSFRMELSNQLFIESPSKMINFQCEMFLKEYF
jgi:UDP-glucose 4-epimerase